jgi:hypothetical protein
MFYQFCESNWADTNGSYQLEPFSISIELGQNWGRFLDKSLLFAQKSMFRGQR